jgi:DNA-binding MarR family transcriptional regulator
VSAEPSDHHYLSDWVALARQAWIRETRARLARQGFNDYRRSDAFLLRRLRRASSSLGEMGSDLEMTRQGARKLVEGLVQRGYARVARDATDARRFNVELTASGAAYAEAIVATIRSMNREIAKNISRDDLEVALSVMQTFTRAFQERGA